MVLLDIVYVIIMGLSEKFVLFLKSLSRYAILYVILFPLKLSKENIGNTGKYSD